MSQAKADRAEKAARHQIWTLLEREGAAALRLVD